MHILDENRILVVYVPATGRAFVFRVKSVVNKGRTRIDYGPLPISANFPLASFVTGTVPAPADGVMPGYTYVPAVSPLSFPYTEAYDPYDMWYLPKDYNERLFHVILDVMPSWLRIEVQIPKGVSQGRFQRDRVITGVEKLFGFTRGSVEVVHLPEIRYGYRFANDSSLNVYTGARFEYGEYLIETPRDPEFIFAVLTKRIQADRWITLPITTYDAVIRRAFEEVYGFEGFPVYGLHERERALQEYRALLQRVIV